MADSDLLNDKRDESTGWTQQEFEMIDSGELHLNRRAIVADRLGKKPGASIPGPCENWAETAMVYRQATMGCIRAHALVMCLQGTTELDDTG